MEKAFTLAASGPSVPCGWSGLGREPPARAGRSGVSSRTSRQVEGVAGVRVSGLGLGAIDHEWPAAAPWARPPLCLPPLRRCVSVRVCHWGEAP